MLVEHQGFSPPEKYIFVKRCYSLIHNDILVEPLSTGSFAGLLLEISDYRYKDLYLYGSFELMVLFFEPTTVCGLMCRN